MSLRDALRDDLLRLRQRVTEMRQILDELVALFDKLGPHDLDDDDVDEPTDIYPGDVPHAPWVDTEGTD